MLAYGPNEVAPVLQRFACKWQTSVDALPMCGTLALALSGSSRVARKTACMSARSCMYAWKLQ